MSIKPDILLRINDGIGSIGKSSYFVGFFFSIFIIGAVELRVELSFLSAPSGMVGIGGSKSLAGSSLKCEAGPGARILPKASRGANLVL